MVPLPFFHVDVFSPRLFSGNSLAVFPDARGLSAVQMLAITREMRHFESIFLEPDGRPRAWRARVFDLVEELDFAGHPVLGAACVAHQLAGEGDLASWQIRLKAKTVRVETRRRGGHFSAVVDQGRAAFLGLPPAVMCAELAGALGLGAGDLDPALPPEVVSTGLCYLVAPVAGADALARVRIARADFGAWLAGAGAQFVYVLDASTPEGRHWNNDGVLEDVATGSGAGCVAAYLRKHGRLGANDEIILRQGRFVGRPSEIRLRARGAGEDVATVEVGGDVALVGEGRLVEVSR